MAAETLHTDWTKVFVEWHEPLLEQGRRVAIAIGACNREEPASLTRDALNEIEAELKLHRMMLNAVRLGIVHGHLTGSVAE
jgi:acyl-coenzyme A thioesterase PaaI-like protein